MIIATKSISNTNFQIHCFFIDEITLRIKSTEITNNLQMVKQSQLCDSENLISFQFNTMISNYYCWTRREAFTMELVGGSLFRRRAVTTSTIRSCNLGNLNISCC